MAQSTSSLADAMPVARKRPVWRWVAGVAGVVVVAIGIAAGWAGYLQLIGNVHTVEPGVVYRSKQLGGLALRALIYDHGIKTVLNLRGGSMDDGFYRDEVAAVDGSGAKLIDLPLSDSEVPTPAQLAELKQILMTAPTPLLIHCKAGADRTGLASALYELLVMHEPAAVAAGQLSFAFGHFPWLGSRSVAMDETFWAVAKEVAAGT